MCGIVGYIGKHQADQDDCNARDQLRPAQVHVLENALLSGVFILFHDYPPSVSRRILPPG